MDKLAELSMESSKVDTSLAKKYLSDHDFKNFPLPEEVWLFNEDPKLIEKMPIKNCNIRIADAKYQIGTSQQLAKTIAQNELLFCQLEHELRNIDVADVKNSITLISQHLQCPNTFWAHPGDSNGAYSILMSEESPLHVLGCLAYALQFELSVVIVACKTTAPLCHLFVQLCSNVGLNIPLFLMDKPKNFEFSAVINAIENINENGCIAVVTEQADVDSALDVLIYSSTTAPWRFRRVFVQENVYEEFKSGLAWKCTRQDAGEVFTARGKTFSCDTIRDSSPTEIAVEAYRTVKELFALMKSAPFLSVWAEGSELSHEIALGSGADYVWINDYASFSGPPLASCPPYALVYNPPPKLVSSPDLALWCKRQDDERKDFVYKALKDSECSDELLRAALHWQRDSFVHRKDGRICLGIDRPFDESMEFYIKVNNEKDMMKLISLSVGGCGIAYKCDGSFKTLLQSLERSGVPLRNILHDATGIAFTKRFKVIQSRFGTVFAN